MATVPANVTTISAIGILLALCYGIYAKLFRGSKYPLPPGPKGEFLLGHYRVVPFEAPFKQYAKWGKEYNSDVLYFETFGTKWIVLNSLKSAIDLLDKRGNKYSDRPRFVLNELMGWAPTLTWLRWSPKMLQHRKLLQAPFTRSKVHQFQPMQHREAIKAVQDMLHSNGNCMSWNNAVRRFAVAVVLSISYGIEIKDESSPYIKLADDTAKAISNSGAPASSIVDRFPATRYLPSWFPFMERKRYANKWRFAILNITNIPFAAAMKNAKEKVQNTCFTQDRLAVYTSNMEKGIPNTFTLDDIKGAAATLYIAGNETTATTIILFVLYMMQHPPVLAKAQDELSRLIGSGPGRLPTFDDIPNLEYLNLILQETYRMCPLSPLGIPHASIEDDVYEGMFIPKGTIVYQNVWAMTHDERVYSKPFEYWPERFLPKEQGGNGEPWPTGNFGFGRRVCLGRNLAENSMFIIMATIIATVDISWPPGPDGKPARFEPEWSFRGQAHPLPFPAKLTSRSEKAEELLMGAA